MAHLAVVAPPFAGHFNPLQALAGELVRRGHRVSFYQQADAAALMRQSGAAFVPLGQYSHPPGSLAGPLRRIAALRGVWGTGAVLADLAASTDMLCRCLPAALRAGRVDGIIADGTEAAGGLVARHLGIPCITIACALPINTEPAVPPPFVDWGYDPSPDGLRRHRGAARIAGLISWRMRRVIARHAAAWGLGALRDIEDCLSPDLQITQLVPGLDFPRTAVPPQQYVGPLRGADLGTPPDLPPRYVHASLGTLQGHRAGLFATIAAACAQAGIPCVIAHGGALDAAAIARLPGSPLCFPFLPQPAVMRRAVVAVTHGGLNTVLDALSAGVPVIAIPLAFEQAAIGARLVRSGAGLSVRRPTAGGLAALIAGADRLRPAAAKLQAQIASAGGVPLAADLIEARLRATM